MTMHRELLGRKSNAPRTTFGDLSTPVFTTMRHEPLWYYVSQSGLNVLTRTFMRSFWSVLSRVQFIEDLTLTRRFCATTRCGVHFAQHDAFERNPRGRLLQSLM